MNEDKRYIRLYNCFIAIMESGRPPEKWELDAVVEIVKEDFPKPPPTEPIETGIVVNHSPSITTTLTGENY